MWLSDWLDLPIPGAVIGLGLLLVVLACVPQLEQLLAPTADPLLRHMGLLIIPAAVGLMALGPLLLREGAALALILVVSTVLTGLVAALSYGRRAP